MESTKYISLASRETLEINPNGSVAMTVLATAPGSSGKNNATEVQEHKQTIRRMSMYTLVVIFTSFCLLLLATAFVAFLWFGSSPLWQTIVLANWITRSVTLSAITLRLAISLQAGVATSMLASLIIEGKETGIQLIDIPEIAIMVFSNNGPYSLLWKYLKQAKSGGLVLLLAVLAFSTLAAQFSSTLLLSDITLTPTLAPIWNVPTLYSIINGQGAPELADSHFWTQHLSEYPTFGEYPDQAAFLPNEQDEIDDTGTVLRALIPISDKDTRERLTKYKGPAFVFDARTVCVPAKFSSLGIVGYTGANKTKSDDEYVDYATIHGNVAPQHTVKNAAFNMTGMDFECNLLLDDRNPTSFWTLCPLTALSGGLISALDINRDIPIQYSSHTSFDWKENPRWLASDGKIYWPTDIGRAYLLYNMPWSKGFESRSPYPYRGQAGSTKINGSSSDTEFRLFYEEESTQGVLKASLCYDALPSTYYTTLQDFNVTLSRKSIHREPTSELKLGETTFNTSEIGRQLGVGPPNALESSAGRGILVLSFPDVKRALDQAKSDFSPRRNCTTKDLCNFNDVNTGAGRGDRYLVPWVTWATKPTNTLHFCIVCLVLGVGDRSPPMFTSIFTNALNDTGSPALALQAYLTSLNRFAYYSGLPFFTAQTNITAAIHVDRLIPTSYRGFGAVIAIIVTHIIVCIIIISTFLTRTRFSMVGNVLAVFAQIVRTTQAQELLQDGTMRTDKEIKRAPGTQSKNGLKKRYRLHFFEEEKTVTWVPVDNIHSE